jgi:hypothetical protein
VQEAFIGNAGALRTLRNSPMTATSFTFKGIIEDWMVTNRGVPQKDLVLWTLPHRGKQRMLLCRVRMYADSIDCASSIVTVIVWAICWTSWAEGRLSGTPTIAEAIVDTPIELKLFVLMVVVFKFVLEF